MPWFRIDDGFHDHPKIERLETLCDDAMLFYACLGVWQHLGTDCARRLTDGQFSIDRARKVLASLTEKQRSRVLTLLTSARLIDENEEGIYSFHDWQEYQPSAAEVKAERDARNERQRKWRENKRGRHYDNASTDATHNASTDATHNASESLPTRASSLPFPSVPFRSPPGRTEPEDRVPELTLGPPPSKSRDTQRVFDHWRKVMASPRSVLDAKRKRRIEWALGAYGLDVCLRAIDGCRADLFSMGENDRGKTYNDLELIFRDAAHVEKFSETKPNRDIVTQPMPPAPGPRSAKPINFRPPVVALPPDLQPAALEKMAHDKLGNADLSRMNVEPIELARERAKQQLAQFVAEEKKLAAETETKIENEREQTP